MCHFAKQTVSTGNQLLQGLEATDDFSAVVVVPGPKQVYAEPKAFKMKYSFFMSK